MKLIMENWRNYIEEEIASSDDKKLREEGILESQDLLDEGLLDRIRNIFRPNDPFEGDFGSFDPTVDYQPGTYGFFAKATGVISTLKKHNIEANKKTVSAAAQSALGGGDSKAGALAGMAYAVGGVVLGLSAAAGAAAGGLVLGLVGAGVAAVSLVKAFRANPSLAEKYPVFHRFRMNRNWVKIIDDKLEEQIVEDFQKDFISKVKSAPDQQMQHIDQYVQKWLSDRHQQNTVTTTQGE